jgi:hypothetical protein
MYSAPPRATQGTMVCLNVCCYLVCPALSRRHARTGTEHIHLCGMLPIHIWEVSSSNLNWNTSYPKTFSATPGQCQDSSTN